MKNKPLVSFIIAAFNEEKYIVSCVESCFDQTYPLIEVCITDDGSTDNMWEVLNKKYRGNKKVKLGRFKVNKGKVAAFNNSYQMSSGEYIAFIGGDDINYKERIESQLNYIGQYGLVCGDLDQYNADCTEIINPMMAKRLFSLNNFDEFDLDKLIKKPIVYGATILIQKETADKIFPLPENLSHEDWWLPLIASYYTKIIYIEKSFVKARQHGKNSSEFYKTLNFSGWKKKVLRDLSYYELLKDFFSGKNILKYNDFLSDKINYFKLLDERNSLKRFVLLFKFKKADLKILFKSMLNVISPKLLFIKFKISFK